MSDGAIWIEQLFASLGVEHIIDVYHGLEYAVEVMRFLGWSEEEQTMERKLWCHGKLNVQDWIQEFAPVARAKGAGEDVLKAIEYLEVRASRMACQTLLKAGLPIGSGQIEGMNKRPCPKRFRPKVHLGIKKRPKPARCIFGVKTGAFYGQEVSKLEMGFYLLVVVSLLIRVVRLRLVLVGLFQRLHWFLRRNYCSSAPPIP